MIFQTLLICGKFTFHNFIQCGNVYLGRLYWERKTHTKMDQIRFCFVLFLSYGNENGSDSYSQIRLSVS